MTPQRAKLPSMSVDMASIYLSSGPGLDTLANMYLVCATARMPHAQPFVASRSRVSRSCFCFCSHAHPHCPRLAHRQDSLHEHYFATTAVQALTLVATGDALAQTIEMRSDDEQAYDPVRTLRMGLLGMCIGGFGTARWLQYLESVLPLREAESGMWSAFEAVPAWMYSPVLRCADNLGLDQAVVGDAYFVLMKATLDACLWAPLANTAYLVLTPLTEGESIETVKGILKERFVPVMKTELMTFFPYNLISFSLVPPLVRPFTTGFVSMCFAVFISWITHLEPAEEGSSAAAEQTPEQRAEPSLIEAGVAAQMPAITLPGGREVTLVAANDSELRLAAAKSR